MAKLLHLRLTFFSLFLFIGMAQGVEKPADPPSSESPFGVLDFLDWNDDWNDFQYDSTEKMERAADLMEKAGVGMIRQTFPWTGIEPEKGKFHFERYDQILDIVERHHLPLLGVLGYSAAWTGKNWIDPPPHGPFLNYVRTVVRRYKARVKYWEIWNEPDQKAYWSVDDQTKTYTELLKVVYAAVKQEDPTAVVVLGSSNTPFPVRHMYRNGAQLYFDVMNIHPFVNPLLPDAVSQIKGIYDGVRRIMEKNNDGAKPIWITELGCPGVSSQQKDLTWWEGASPSEDKQAQFLTDVYEQALTWPGLEKIFWAFFRDTNQFHDGVDTFGLVRRDFSPKPSYQAYQRIAGARRKAKN